MYATEDLCPGCLKIVFLKKNGPGVLRQKASFVLGTSLDQFQRLLDELGYSGQQADRQGQWVLGDRDSEVNILSFGVIFEGASQAGKSPG